MSCCRRCSLAILNDSASRGARVTGIADADADSAAGTQLFMDDRQGGVRESRDDFDPVEHRVDCGRVFLHRAQYRWHDPQDVDALRGGNRDERRSVGTAAEKRNEVSLIRRDSTTMRAGAEPARRVKAFHDRTDKHVSLGGLCEFNLSQHIAK